MGIWPYWHLTQENDNDVYELVMFAGAFLEEDGVNIPIAVFKSLAGGLNAAIPMNAIGHKTFSTRATAKEAAACGNEKDVTDKVNEYNEEEGL